jgi:hypothetical protein
MPVLAIHTASASLPELRRRQVSTADAICHSIWTRGTPVIDGAAMCHHHRSRVKMRERGLSATVCNLPWAGDVQAAPPNACLTLTDMVSPTLDNDVESAVLLIVLCLHETRPR